MKTITLELDDLDYDAIQTAIARRQGFMGGGLWPNPASFNGDLGERGNPLADGSNIAGLAVAEICRGWMEMLDMSRNRGKERD